MASRVLVTGAAGAMGVDTVARLHDLGYEVVATDIRSDGLEGLDADFKVELDITDPAAVRRTVDSAAPVHHLINLVGQGYWTPIEIESPEITKKAFEINLIGPIYMMQAVLPQLRRNGGGTIINLSSEAAHFIAPLVGFYSAAKAALEVASFALRLETHHMGIRIAIVRPMSVGTGFAERRYYGDSDDPQYRELIDAVLADLRKRTSKSMPAVEIAKLLTAILEMEDPGFRWFLGDNAEVTLANGPDDTEFEGEREAQMSRLMHAAQA